MEPVVSAPVAFARRATPEAFRYSGSELEAVAEARNYYRWITRWLAPYVGPRTLEAGAGIGTFTEYLLGLRPDVEVTAVEPAENNYPELARRFRGNPRVRTEQGYLDESRPAGTADTVVAVNVMEHVPDDRAFVRAAAQVLVEGGHFCVLVPALPFLYGSLDEAFEHYRRYTRGSIRTLLEGTGLEPVVLRYMNLPGVVAWWLAARMLRRRTVSPLEARIYDRCVIPLVSALERHWSPPLGQSLFLVARRTGGAVG